MKEKPIGAVRLAVLLAGVLVLGAAFAQSPGYPAKPVAPEEKTGEPVPA